MESHEINSLSDLRRRRELLRLEIKVAEESIGRSFKQTEYRIKDAVIRNLLIPLGVGSIAAVFFRDESTEWARDKPQWLVFLRQLVDTVDQRFGRAAEEDDEEES